MKETVLISGSAGFIGSHIADSFIKEGYIVLGFDNLSSGRIENAKKQPAFLELDLRDVGTIFDNHKIDLVIHCAAQTNVRISLEDPMYDATENILGSLSLLEAMRKGGTKRIIFLSTGGAIYHELAPRPTHEESVISPISPYGIAKYSIENYLNYYAEIHDFEPTILRLANVYGSKAVKGIINICLNKFKQGERVDIFGGLQTRDYVHVSDVVSAVHNVVEIGLEGVFNVGTGKETSLDEVVDEVVGANTNWKLLINKCEAIRGELSHSSLSSAKLQKFGWVPKTTLHKGIQKLKEY